MTHLDMLCSAVILFYTNVGASLVTVSGDQNESAYLFLKSRWVMNVEICSQRTISPKNITENKKKERGNRVSDVLMHGYFVGVLCGEA